MQNHLIDLSAFSKQTLLAFLDRAERLKEAKAHTRPILDTLKDHTVCLLFFENSTRTHASFELGAKRLGSTLMHLPIHASSVQKGESIVDTFLTIQALHADFFIMRHASHQAILDCIPHAKNTTHIINAGTGTIAHPTQALIDILTIQEAKGLDPDLKIVIIGDILHSRVAASQMEAFEILGMKNIVLTGPADLMPEIKNKSPVRYIPDLNEALEGADIIALLRIQLERIPAERRPSLKEYATTYGLNAKNLMLAKKDAIILHPGPINRDLEITQNIAYGPQSRILQQVENGLAIRMAVMQSLKEGDLC